MAPLSNMKTIFYDKEMKYFETVSFLVNISIVQFLQSGWRSICHHGSCVFTLWYLFYHRGKQYVFYHHLGCYMIFISSPCYVFYHHHLGWGCLLHDIYWPSASWNMKLPFHKTFFRNKNLSLQIVLMSNHPLIGT